MMELEVGQPILVMVVARFETAVKNRVSLLSRGRPSRRRGAHGGTKGTAPARFAEDTEPGEVHGYRNNGVPSIR